MNPNRLTVHDGSDEIDPATADVAPANVERTIRGLKIFAVVVIAFGLLGAIGFWRQFGEANFGPSNVSNWYKIATVAQSIVPTIVLGGLLYAAAVLIGVMANRPAQQIVVSMPASPVAPSSSAVTSQAHHGIEVQLPAPVDVRTWQPPGGAADGESLWQRPS